MSIRTLEQAFNAKFHDSKAYADFCSLDLTTEVEEIELKSRRIFKTSKKLSEFLRFIDKVMFDHLCKHKEAAHAYIKEKSALTAVQDHAGSKYFFMTDIEHFFNNVTAKDITRVLNRDAAHIPISDFINFLPQVVELTTYGGSIPIGFATSPKLSNAFLLEFDSALYYYCQANSLIYTRYSDDIIISSESRNQLKELETHVQELLHEHASPKLSLNKEKTRIAHIGSRVKILGMVIMPNGQITIDSKYKKTFESLLHYYVNDKEKFHQLLADKIKTKNKEHSLFGLLQYAKSIDPIYINKLQRKYGAYALSSLMENKWSD